MKKSLLLSFSILVALVLSMSVDCLAQADKSRPSSDVDGHVWANSTTQEKHSFLYGAGSAIVLEYHLRKKHSEEPSRFVNGWVDALRDVSWSDLASKIDSYYKNNPDKLDRNVFSVIWREVIKPKMKN